MPGKSKEGQPGHYHLKKGIFIIHIALDFSLRNIQNPDTLDNSAFIANSF